MSIKVMAAVWERSQASEGTLLVALALADFSDEEGRSWPRQDVIAEKARMKRRNVLYALKRLEELGEVTRQKIRHGSSMLTEYQFTAQILHTQVEVQSAMDCTPPVQPVAHMEPSREPSVVRETSSLLRDEEQTRPKTRARDPLWDVLEETLGKVTNELERGRRNKAIKALRESEATPDQVRQVVRDYKRRWPGVEVTALGVASNWSLLREEGTVLTAKERLERTLRIAEEARGESNPA